MSSSNQSQESHLPSPPRISDFTINLSSREKRKSSMIYPQHSSVIKNLIPWFFSAQLSYKINFECLMNEKCEKVFLIQLSCEGVDKRFWWFVDLMSLQSFVWQQNFGWFICLCWEQLIHFAGGNLEISKENPLEMLMKIYRGYFKDFLFLFPRSSQGFPEAFHVSKSSSNWKDERFRTRFRSKDLKSFSKLFL